VNFDIGYNLLLPALQYFAEKTNSYGWAIILLTLAVRIIVWPLVVKSTQSMQRMSKLQPKLNELKNRYKSDPEMFQKKSMEFFAKNKVNPMSGCWPLLVQMPILIALYATFTGPPFGDKAIDVKVMVSDKQVSKVEAQTSNNNSPYVSKDGEKAKLVVFPGESTINAGDSIDFGVRAVEGKVAEEFSPTWKIVAPGTRNPADPGVAQTDATIAENGHAVFIKPGEYHVQALIPGIAKGERFWCINGLGKIARGAELIKPIPEAIDLMLKGKMAGAIEVIKNIKWETGNWDSLVLILLFGATMYVSQKFTVSTPKPAPGQELDEQQIIQQQTMKTMPIVTTGMFMFIPLPAGVLLYLVISNVFQTLQTMLIMKMPVPAFVDVSDDGPESGPQPGGGGGQRKPGGGSGPKKGDESKAANSSGNVSTISGARASRAKRKAKRKKN
jgi:YidC/Oxa1 family membrane protein insertase